MATLSIHRNLPRLLQQARESVMAHTRPGLREYRLSDHQWRVLRVPGEHTALETGRVAREALITGPSLTGMLNQNIAFPNLQPDALTLLRDVNEFMTLQSGGVLMLGCDAGRSLAKVGDRVET